MENKDKLEEIKKEDEGIIRITSIFSHIPSKKYVDELPVLPSGKYVVDDSAFCPMSEAIRQLNRVSDPSSGQLAEVYDFPNGVDNGKIIPITRQRDFGDLAEISQKVREESEGLNNEILKGQLEAAEKAAFEKELAEVRSSVSDSGKSV